MKKTDLKLLEEFHRLALLEELCLDFPTIRKFPKFVVDLKSLRELILHCDCLNRLPENLTRLTALHRLQISRCSSLNVLPHNIGALKNLKELLLLDCKLLGGLPSSITELKGSLTRLYLSCLPWSSLPESIAALTSLKTLSISLFVWLERVPESLTQLTSLESLDFFHCSGRIFYEGNPHPVKGMSAYKYEGPYWNPLGAE